MAKLNVPTLHFLTAFLTHIYLVIIFADRHNVLFVLLLFNIYIIVLQTRHKDWQAGGLETKYYLSHLKEADSQIQQYEESAAPSGWSCHWDRYALPCHHVIMTYIFKYGPSLFMVQLVNKRVGHVDII